MLTLLYYIIIVLKKQNELFMVYVAAVIPAFILSFVLVRGYGINGGAMSYFISITGVTAALYVIAKKNLRKSIPEAANE